MTYEQKNDSDGSSFTVEDTKDAVDAIETGGVNGDSAEGAAEAFENPEPTTFESDSGFPVGAGNILLTDLGAIESTDDTFGFPDGSNRVFHPSPKDSPVLGFMFVAGHVKELTAAGYDDPAIALAVLDDAVVELTEDGGPGAVFFPERSNFHPEDGDSEEIDLRKITYFRLR